MKRIFHIIPTLGSGGAERQLTNIIRSSNAEEFAHRVCVFRDADFFAPAIIEAGHQIHRLDAAGKHPWISATRKILRLIDAEKPDLIVSWLYDASIVSRIVHFFKPAIPLINTLHLTEYDKETIRAGGWSPLKVEGLRWFDKLSAQLVDPYFTACSVNVKKSYRQTLGIKESRVEVIYNGVDPASLESDEKSVSRLRKELNIPDKAFVYVSVGRLAAQKNYSYLLKAFAQTAAKIPSAILMIVGTGPLESELKKLSESLQISGQVRFLGRREDVGVCLGAADVFLIPSLFEGHPLALVEAMFKKLPSVASDIKVLREVLTDGENGLLVPLDQPEKLTAAMIKLFEQPEFGKKLGEKAFRDAENRFHICKTVAEWEDFYSRVINEARHEKAL